MPRKAAAIEPPVQPARHHIVVADGTGVVTLGRTFTPDEEQWLHDHIVIGLRHLDSIALSTSHLVKVKAKWGVELFERLNDDGTIAEKLAEQVQTNRPTHCPDCGRELIGTTQDKGPDYLRCPNAAPFEGDAPEWGDVVACGVKPVDPTIVRAG